MKRTVIRLGEQPDWSSEKIVINTGTSDNILKLSRTDASANKAYREMLAHDYVLYMHSNEKSFFIKRTLVSTLWERKDLIQFGDTFYTLMDVPENKVNRLAPKRLVVIFSSMPSAKDYLSDKIAPRMFVQNYPSLWKQVVKNTMILRIMDLNLSYGSYYMNAGSYNTFEDDVQGIIAKVCEQNGIHKDDVVLYGGSKAGTGALYHALKGDYQAVVVDPIFTMSNYISSGDIHFLEGYLPTDLLPTMQKVADECANKYEKIIIGAPNVKINYDGYSLLNSPVVTLLDVFDEHIKTHPDVAANSTFEQVACINTMLLNSKNLHALQQKIRNNEFTIPEQEPLLKKVDHISIIRRGLRKVGRMLSEV